MLSKLSFIICELYLNLKTKTGKKPSLLKNSEETTLSLHKCRFDIILIKLLDVFFECGKSELFLKFVSIYKVSEIAKVILKNDKAVGHKIWV